MSGQSKEIVYEQQDLTVEYKEWATKCFLIYLHINWMRNKDYIFGPNRNKSLLMVWLNVYLKPIT